MNDWQMIGRLVKNSEFSATGTQTGHETQRQRVNRSREPQDEAGTRRFATLPPTLRIHTRDCQLAAR